jgi:GrpB-like predicted nucleotidyltransferase (UPF0157 family)
MTPERKASARAAIVTRMEVDEPITVVAYDPEWPAHFEREATRLQEVLDVAAGGIEHIGSTAVGGLAAKPVVDLMIGVDDLSRTDELARQLGGLGYEDCGRTEDRRYFRNRAAGQQFNAQVVEYGSPTWDANLLFRDYLRSNSDAAQGYADAKRVAAHVAPMLLAYSTLKDPIIEDILRRARS